MADAIALNYLGAPEPWTRLAMPDNLPSSPLTRLERPAVFAPDGKRLAAIDCAANNGQYRLIKPGQMQLVFVQYKTEIGRVIQWDLVTGREMPRLAHVGQKILAITYSPDGRIVAGLGQYDDAAKRSCEDIHLWEAATGAAVLRIEKPAAGMRCLALAPDGRRLAVGFVDGSIRLWDVATGKLLEQLDGHRGDISALQFAPDGKTLLSGSADTTVLIWDMTRPTPRQESSDLPPRTLDRCWAELAGRDAVKAYRAVWTMASVPAQAVPFLDGRLKRFVPPDDKQIRRWIAELDSDDYESRQAALQSLAGLGDRIELLVKEALKRNISLEMRRRLEQLPSMPRAVPSLQEVRAMQILELIGTAEARTLLDALHRGAGGAGPTREAGESLERLARRPAGVLQ
jgi:dipeptidyl aminopeptidase/acylaminoacyl peptidase